MKDFRRSKLIQNLRLLQPSELNSLNKWLSSPWANNNKNLVRLFEILLPYYPEFDALRLDKSYLFKKLYPDKPFNDRWMRNLMAALNQSVTQFFIYQHLGDRPTDQQRLLVDIWLERGKTQWAEAAVEATVRRISRQDICSREDHLDIFLLQEQLYFQPDTYFRQQAEEQLLERAGQHLDQAYLLSSVRLAVEHKERNLRLQTEALVWSHIQFWEYLNNIYKLPAVSLYLLRLNINQPLSQDQYKKLVSRYYLTVDQFELRDRKAILMYLINDGSRIYQQGYSEVLPQLFVLYQFGIQQKYLLTHGRITESTYLNVITLGNVLQQYDYIDRFVFEFSKALPQKVQLDATTWARAKTQYHRGQFQDCIEELKDYGFTDKLFVHRARFLLIQAFFELFLIDDTYYDLLMSRSTALAQKMRNERRLNRTRSQAIITLIHYVKRLAKWSNQIDPSAGDLQKIVDSIDQEKNIQGKVWLEQKIEFLKRRLS